MLADEVKNLEAEICLEVGVGSAIVTKELARVCRFTVGTDVELAILLNAKAELRKLHIDNEVNLVCCDGAQPFRDYVFDVAVSNPPYLPSKEVVDITVDGGVDGLSVTRKILGQVLPTIKGGGHILFLVSSFSDHESLQKELEVKGHKYVIRSKKHIFFEDIFIVELSIESTTH